MGRSAREAAARRMVWMWRAQGVVEGLSEVVAGDSETSARAARAVLEMAWALRVPTLRRKWRWTE